MEYIVLPCIVITASVISVGVVAVIIYLPIEYFITRNDPPKWSKPHTVCQHSHTEITMVYSPATKTPMATTNTVCDRYSENYFAEFGSQQFELRKVDP